MGVRGFTAETCKEKSWFFHIPTIVTFHTFYLLQKASGCWGWTLGLHSGSPWAQDNEAMCLCLNHSQHLNLCVAANEEKHIGGQVHRRWIRRFVSKAHVCWFCEGFSRDPQCFIIMPQSGWLHCKVPGRLQLPEFSQLKEPSERNQGRPRQCLLEMWLGQL